MVSLPDHYIQQRRLITQQDCCLTDRNDNEPLYEFNVLSCVIETKKQGALMKKPPNEIKRSIQYDLFSQFITNDRSEVSNTLDIWDSIPKYFFTPQQVGKLRTETGHADPFVWNYEYQHKQCRVVTQPALIQQKEGGFQAFFPGVTEELVEEALKKILSEQNNAFHDAGKSETWVKFSLSMIRKELKSKGKNRNLLQIKHAIDVMSSCVISLSVEDKEVWKGTILQDLVSVNRQDYIADSSSYHVARLPLFVSQGINTFGYRQFNYTRLMSCNDQLTRWLYKRLINRFKQANMINDYHLMYSTIVESGLLQQGLDKNNRKKLVRALDELVAIKVLRAYEEDVRKEGRKIVDVKYKFFATSEFIGEQKAANKRSTDGQKRIKKD